MKKLLTQTTLISTASLALIAEGATLNLSAITDFDSNGTVNTSATTPYDVNGTQTTNVGGYASGGITDTQTFHFVDTTTGIRFNYDITITSIGGIIDGTTGILGVDDRDIDLNQGYTMTLSNMTVDLSSYITGSFMGFAGITLDTATGGGDGFGYGFQTIGFANFTQLGDPANNSETVLSVTDGSSSLNYSDLNNNNFDYGAGSDGFSFPNINSNGGSFTFTVIQPNTTNDADVDLSFATTHLSLELLEVVPEPSAVTLLAISGLTLLSRHKRA